MMLIRSLHTSIDDRPNQESSCVWLLDEPESWQQPTNPILVTKHTNEDNNINTVWSQNLLSSSQLSTEVNMSETSTLNYVKRRNVSPPTIVYKRRKVKSVNLTSGSVDGDVNGDPKHKVNKCLGLHITDSCSSSKSNLDHGSVGFLKQQQVDDVGEWSSSSVVNLETNSCLAFLKQHGAIKRRVSTTKPTSNYDVWCFKACKVCDRLANTLKTLICDLCEDMFHMSCCNPVVKKVPVGDWFCGFCSRMKLKEMETSSDRSSGNCLGPIASMLRDCTKRFRSSVRIGDEFQVEVPDWAGPLTDELDDYPEPSKVSALECGSDQECASRKLSSLSSIGNWLQCREVVDDVDGSICGKWRRAPLFEVQSDKWECFSSVLWDPTHADCAVPQELDTDQVLKQLKYIETLRPRLSAKRWKLRVNTHVERKEHTADPRNTQKS